MFYIVGLGNPRKEYEHTRHNVGWEALHYLISKHRLPSPSRSSKYAGSISEGVLYGEEATLLFPETFMNRSGSAVRRMVPKGADREKLIVIYDDVDVPFGEIKLSSFGSSKACPEERFGRSGRINADRNKGFYSCAHRHRKEGLFRRHQTSEG